MCQTIVELYFILFICVQFLCIQKLSLNFYWKNIFFRILITFCVITFLEATLKNDVIQYKWPMIGQCTFYHCIGQLWRYLRHYKLLHFRVWGVGGIKEISFLRQRGKWVLRHLIKLKPLCTILFIQQHFQAT